jgi:hypothetical protein
MASAVTWRGSARHAKIAQMPVGLVYDVHGNLPALEAVLADARGTGVDRWVLGGDYASFGAWPSEVVERLDALQDAVWIRGNWDRWQAGDEAALPDQPELHEALVAVRESLGDALVRRLGALPAREAQGDALFCTPPPAATWSPSCRTPGRTTTRCSRPWTPGASCSATPTSRSRASTTACCS